MCAAELDCPVMKPAIRSQGNPAPAVNENGVSSIMRPFSDVLLGQYCGLGPRLILPFLKFARDDSTCYPPTVYICFPIIQVFYSRRHCPSTRVQSLYL